MKCSVMNISPKLAEKFLDGNVINRSVSPSLVERYARDMKNGDWQINGEAITFNKAKELTNGQHRLMAVIKSGKTIPMVVIEDVDNDVNIYDRGRCRTAADSLVLSGMDRRIANSQTVALARMVFCIKTGEQRRTDAELKEFLSLNGEDAATANDICCKGSKGCPVPTRSASFMVPVFFALKCGISEEVLSRFIYVVQTGLYESSKEISAAVLRNDFLTKKVMIRSYSERIISGFCVEKAIDDFYSGKKRKRSYASCNEPIFSNLTIELMNGVKK